MPAVVVSPVTANRTGTSVTTPAGVVPDATFGATVVNDGQTFLRFVVGATPANMTVATNGTVDGLATVGRVYTGAGSGDYFLGPFPVAQYGSTLALAFTNVTTCKIGAVSCAGLS